ncbi:amino acid racemase [Phytoactinopolyspora alkaliphila]|uniref:Amino acid racemase n=1 Tax=Phytoactinopolyspora alkaliphila TaxID=1783498 RepID=A0A6N9YNV0_9ACTN|nr:amino acid racemase [Phytoactinopolyspora alkaliphila]NED96673.1 amino acid racemase [Phytoactinopolyspora alkaliphila]
MRHLGILAHSIEGAALCLRTFCQHGFRELGPHMHPDVTLDCIAMGHSMPAWDADDYPPIRSLLATSTERLRAAGAEFFVCPDNTAHIALGTPGEPLALPGLHIADVVAERAAGDGRRKVGILATKYTMDNDMYPAAFRRRGIDSAVPEDDERAVVDDIIFSQLVHGVFTDEARDTYVEIIKGLAARGCDAVALVCTEIPLLVDDASSPLPTLDSTRLLAHTAFEVAVGRRELPAWRGGDRP